MKVEVSLLHGLPYKTYSSSILLLLGPHVNSIRKNILSQSGRCIACIPANTCRNANCSYTRILYNNIIYTCQDGIISLT